MDKEKLEKLAKLVRYYILRMTTKAGSGHATSSLSSTDIMVALFFNKLRFDLDHPDNPNNDRVIFSKGHASPLLYALWAAAGAMSEKELLAYRKFESPLEGHPTPRFKYVEVATGSLGQGLSIGLGMAIALRAQYQNLPRVYVLMGDSEVSEGSVWEAVQLASYYKVGNLVGIVDVNRLGQSGPTMLEWDVEKYQHRFESFGWTTYVIDGHDFEEILKVLGGLPDKSDRPQMIIAKTIKGKGVSFLENREGWHGKALNDEQFEEAAKELGKVDKLVRGEIAKPVSSKRVFFQKSKYQVLRKNTKYRLGEMVATRKAYGEALAKLGEFDERIVCLDAEVKNSTYAAIFKEKFPDRYLEMFCAEQNMVGVALGMSKRGYVPFVSTFAAFFTRAHDSIRMAAYSGANIKFIGSHTGVSIGEDGPSQMGLEDMALFRGVFGSIVLAPSDAVSCAKLVEVAAVTEGLIYIRTARPPTPVIYRQSLSTNKNLSFAQNLDSRDARIRQSLSANKGSEEFKIGGSKIVRKSHSDKLTIVACGVCLIEAVRAAEELKKEGINVRIIDAYSIKPIDEVTLRKCAEETNNLIITVEDHYFEGGLGDAVLNVFAGKGRVRVNKLAVCRMPLSGKGDQLLDFEGISFGAIVDSVHEVLLA